MVTRGFLVGLPLWDYGQKNSLDVEYCKIDPDFYRKELDSRLQKFASYLGAVEMQQEAHYQHEHNRSWSKLDLMRLRRFRTFLATNRFWAIHARTQDVDVSEYDDEQVRSSSVREVCGAIDFAVRVNADAVVLHPGTYNLKSGRFWPKADEALALTNNRRVAFSKSLVEIIEYFVRKVKDLEDDLERYQSRNAWLMAALRELLYELEHNTTDEVSRVRTEGEIFRIVDDHEIPVWVYRYCKNPGKEMHLALENVEPPNFLCCTPRQIGAWHGRASEIYLDACNRQSLPEHLRDKYRPMLALDPNHLLNSKVILTQASNKPISHLFEDYSELHVPFVTLPCDMPVGTGGRINEPILNRFMREHSDNVLYTYLAGAQRCDNSMTTHDPIKAFRTKMFVQPGPSGLPAPKFSTGAFDPEVELNLEEVVQVLGFDRTFILEVHDCPDELLISSWIHSVEYLEYVQSEYKGIRDHLTRVLERVRVEHDSAVSPSEADTKIREKAARVMADLKKARFYIRPHRASRGLWRPGYEESGFYFFDPLWAQGTALSSVDIFATIKQETKRVWFRALEGVKY